MKRKSIMMLFGTFFLILLTTLNLNGTKEILAIEQLENDKIDFTDKSIKVEFYEETDEFNNTRNKLLSIDNEKFITEENIEGNKKSMEAINDEYKIEYICWKEEEKFINSITVTSFNKNKTINELNRQVALLGFNGKKKTRYFQQIKGKIKSENYQVEELNETLESLDLISNEHLEIVNGTCGKATFNNGNKLTYSINNYTSGKYLIIGTPMIFSIY